MKKIFTILCLMALTLGAQAAAPYKGIQLTFNKSGSGNASPGNVDVVVKDMDGNELTEVQATLTATNMAAFKTGSAAALSRNENFAIVPSAANDGYSNQQNGTIEYTFQITGLRSGFTYTNAALDVYACNGQGASQPNTASTKRYFTFDVSTGSSATDLTPFVSQAGNDICTVPDQDGGLYHKLWNMAANEVKTATDPLYVKVVLTKTSPDNEGCFAGLGKVQLYDDTPETVTEYDAFRMTFNRANASDNTVAATTVAVSATDGSIISGGPTATLTAFQVSSGSADNLVDGTFNTNGSGDNPLKRTSNFLIAPADYLNQTGGKIVYTYKIENISNEFSFNTVGINVYPIQKGGAAQGTDNKTWSFAIETSTDGTTWTAFAATDGAVEMNNAATTADGVLRYKKWNLAASQAITGNTTLYMRVTLTADNIGGGCYAGLGAVELASTINVTYQLMENSVEVKSVVVAQEKNSEISVPTELTSGYYASAYTFPTSGTIGTEDCTITVTATPNTGVVTDRDNLSNNKVYTLTSRRGTLSTNGETLRTNTSGTDIKSFAIVTYEDKGNKKTYLWSVADSKWVKKDGTFTENVADIAENSQFVLTAEGVRNNLKPLFFGGIGDYGINTNASEHVAMNTWTTRDDGNEFVVTENGEFDPTNLITALDEYFNPNYTVTYIVKDANDNTKTLYTSEPVGVAANTTITTLPAEHQRPLFYNYNTVDVTITESGNTDVEFTATLKDNAPVKFTEDATSPHYYNMNIRSQYLVFDETNEDKVKLQATSEPFNPNAAWAFIGNPYAGFNVINQTHGASNVLTYTTVTMDRPTTHNIQFQTGAEAEAKTWLIDTNNNGIVLRMKENTNIYFHHENGNSGKYLRTCSNSEWSVVHNDAGSTIILTTDEAALVQLYNLLKNAPFGEGVNQYSATGVNPEEILANAATVIENEESSQYYDTYQALLNLQSAMTLNMPQAGFYRIKGNTSGKYVSNGGGNGAKYTMVETADETTIFCYDGEKLINYKTGLCFNLPDWTWAYGNESVATTFLDGLSNGGYAIQNGDSNNGKLHLYDAGSSCDRGGMNAVTTSTNTRYREWYLEEVTELPITLRSTDGETYFATFSAPVNVQISGASLNTVTNNNKTAAYNTVDTDMLKAGVGVLLSGTSPTAKATIITEDVAEADYGLVRYYAATAGTGDESMLYLGKGKTSGKAGFYKLGVGTTSNGFKAYLNNTTELGGAKEGLELEFAGVTGIENMEHGTLNMENGAVYNLQGQRVNKAQKGVYIINNKKVVVK